jgi:glycerophosphoryl diester phosphodiesterase
MSSSLQLPVLIAHRGASAYAPENTLAAFIEARKRGARWVEFDVKLSGDGVLIVLHDDNLRRTTGHDAQAAATGSKAIAALDAGKWMAPRFAGQKVPSLAETIALLARLRMSANIEIKPNPGQDVETGKAVVAMLDRLWPRDLPVPVLSSFKDASLAAARQAAPRWPRLLLIDRIGAHWLARARAVGAIGINTNGKRLKARQAAKIKAAGLLLGVYTINRPDLASRLRGWGADCVISDKPDLIAKAIA